jgi:hypothetical protein
MTHHRYLRLATSCQNICTASVFGSAKHLSGVKPGASTIVSVARPIELLLPMRHHIETWSRMSRCERSNASLPAGAAHLCAAG